jgi:GNAT superfamily N-acetyltransferase
MGDPIADQFADRDAFAHLFCTWYVDHRPDCAWVVDDGSGRAVGYLIGSPDAGHAAGDRHGGPEGSRHLVEFALRYGIGRAAFLRPGTARFLRRAAGDLRTDRSVLAAPVDRRRFPADLHINLLPVARGHGLGGALIRTWLDRLGAEGVPGVHLGTFGENTTAIAFFRSQGFRPTGDRVPNPGFRMPDGSRCSVLHFVREIP